MGFQELIGNRDHLAESDILQMNDMYQCKVGRGESSLLVVGPVGKGPVGPKDRGCIGRFSK